MRSKAIFLLTLFLLNTAVGLGCALHMAVETHDHADEISSFHNIHHGVAVNDKEELNNDLPVSSNSTDTCCQDEVNKFNYLNKIIPSASKQVIKIPVFSLSFTNYLSPVLFSDTQTSYIHFITNRQRPPSTPVRIIIQSFQI